MIGTSVITKEQARKVTHGRTPLMPVEYEQAITALVACTTLDETKYWADKSDALAAWAKIYHNDDAARKAKQLKLHAFRRMGQLARELRQSKLKMTGEGYRGFKGRTPGASSVLLEAGMTEGSARVALKLSHIDDNAFKGILSQAKSPAQSARALLPNQTYHDFIQRISVSRTFMRRYTATETSNAVTGAGERCVRVVRDYISELIEWLDELEQRLPK